jgi:hypothetical protein
MGNEFGCFGRKHNENIIFCCESKEDFFQGRDIPKRKSLKKKLRNVWKIQTRQEQGPIVATENVDGIEICFGDVLLVIQFTFYQR